MLFDRIEFLKQTNTKLDLENNSYLAFSGGKDSLCVHYLLDMALPNNKIPRVFINTGIEYNDMVKFVKEMQKEDDRIIIVQPKRNIREMLKEVGYPISSKQHSHNLSIYQKLGMTQTNIQYLGMGEKQRFLCPKILRYQFSEDFNIKCSEKCCDELKKYPSRDYAKENNKTISITGIRMDEGGFRQGNSKCITYNKATKLKMVHPLKPISDEWEEQFILKNNIKLCKLYYPPYSFRRVGCKGCPFSLGLKEQLETMKDLLPNEYKQCEDIWKPVYDEYRRINYRLKGMR